MITTEVYIHCDGMCIDAHWNFFSSIKDAKKELKEMTLMKGHKYEIEVKKIKTTRYAVR